MLNFNTQFSVLLIVSILLIGGCSVPQRTLRPALGTLDTVSFIIKTHAEMKKVLEISDTLNIFFENVFYNNLSISLSYHGNSINRVDSSAYNLLFKRKDYYESIRGDEEKVPLPQQNYIRTVRRLDFMPNASRLGYEPLYLVMSLPYYVRDNQWFIIFGYVDQYCHGDAFGLLVQFSNGEAKILWIIDAGSS